MNDYKSQCMRLSKKYIYLIYTRINIKKKTNNFNTESKPQQGLNIFVHWQTKTVIKVTISMP